jgi:hypothetical protein
LLREIDDVKDELRMMIYFKERQQHVLNEFEINVKHILEQSLERQRRERVELAKMKKTALKNQVEGEAEVSGSHGSDKKNESPLVTTRAKAQWTKDNIIDRKKSLAGQKAELDGLYSSAEQTMLAVRTILPFLGGISCHYEVPLTCIDTTSTWIEAAASRFD